MSHNKERAEKACLNCGTMPLYDRYCQHCGQENVEPKQTLWHLVTHFFSDITHFDGKFFSTMKLLLLKPGFLSAEYVHGRRAKYLDPIRMYLFISAVFFLVMYSMTEIEGIKASDYKAMRYMDSLRKVTKDFDEGLQFQLVSQPGYHTMSIFNVKKSLKYGYAHYDSVQKALPPEKRANLLERYIDRHLIGIYQTYDADPYNFVPNACNIFIHSLSKVFFISLPLFSLFLWLLYIRRRKQWYYVSHAIFTLHYYAVSFMFLFVIMLTYRLDITPDIWAIICGIVILGRLIYLYIAMLRYYGQHWFKTLVKFLVLAIVNAFSLLGLVWLMFLNALAHAH